MLFKGEDLALFFVVRFEDKRVVIRAGEEYRLSFDILDSTIFKDLGLNYNIG